MENANLKVIDFYNCIDEFAPFMTQASWDNSGLLTGKFDNRVSGVLLALDVHEHVVDEAIKLGANLIVSHHPIMFSGRKNLREDDPEADMLCKIVRNNINVISAHTNFDAARGGVNDALADIIGLKNIETIEADDEGFLRIGDIDEITLEKLTEQVRNRLGDAVRSYGARDKIIKRVAVCGGSAGEFAITAYKAGADAYITGEMRYHDCIDLAQKGFATLQAGHDATEKQSLKVLEAEFKQLTASTDIKITLSQCDCLSATAFT